MEKIETRLRYTVPTMDVMELGEASTILAGSTGTNAPGAGGGVGSTGGGQANSTEGFPRFQSVFGDTSEDVDF